MLINLIDDLLDLAKEEQLTFTFNKIYFNMLDVINGAFNTLQFISESRNIKTTLIVNPEHTKYFESVYGDKNRYTQIFLNFISNSLKFTNTGGEVKVTLKIKSLK